MQDGSVVWTPSMIGNWTIGVSDQGFSATIQVNVIQGEIIGIEILLSEEIIRSGDLIVASISAYDNAGNHRSVDGAWSISGELNPVDQGDWYELRPGPIGTIQYLQLGLTMKHKKYTKLILYCISNLGNLQE